MSTATQVTPGTKGLSTDAVAIASRRPVGPRRIEAVVGDASDAPLDVGLRRELDQSALHEQADDFREGRGAVNEKRRPDSTGQ